MVLRVLAVLTLGAASFSGVSQASSSPAEEEIRQSAVHEMPSALSWRAPRRGWQPPTMGS